MQASTEGTYQCEISNAYGFVRAAVYLDLGLKPGESGWFRTQAPVLVLVLGTQAERDVKPAACWTDVTMPKACLPTHKFLLVGSCLWPSQSNRGITDVARPVTQIHLLTCHWISEQTLVICATGLAIGAQYVLENKVVPNLPFAFYHMTIFKTTSRGEAGLHSGSLSDVRIAGLASPGEPIFVKKDERVEIQCESAEGNPAPSLSWNRCVFPKVYSNTLTHTHTHGLSLKRCVFLKVYPHTHTCKHTHTHTDSH